mmetsp:Transcript_27297/g.61692  ORF Transcript_27297/g.61692 Transcript_27297/m.61692 type:complete len:370 (-) Transcript_27297:16-1125(-)
MSASEVAAARKKAAAIDNHYAKQLAEVKAQARRDTATAWRRGQRSALKDANQPRTRYVAATYDSLLSAVPGPLRRLMPSYEAPAEIVGSFTTETPAGVIHHSGKGLIFDLQAANAATQTPPPRGFGFGQMEAGYLSENPAIVHDLFGWKTYDQAADFFTETWGFDLDEPGLAHPCTLTAFDEYLLTLWRMRERPSLTFLSHFGGMSLGATSEVLREWVPRFGQVGRIWVWLPSMEYVERSMPRSFIESGMSSVALIGDATDILTETVRKLISVRNQQRSDKSKHSAAMGLSWCTPSGWTAIASDLVLGRTSEYNAAVALAPQFAAVPPQWSLCYDKGVASLRAHLPNLNNVIVPCFLSGGQYTARRNRV